MRYIIFNFIFLISTSNAFASQLIYNLLDGTATVNHKSYSIHVNKYPFTNSYQYQINNKKSIHISGCRDEIKSFKIKIIVKKHLKDLTLVAKDSLPLENNISLPSIDIRIIKWWYQGAGSIHVKQHKVYLPELLLKDSKLIKVDRLRQENYIRDTEMSGPNKYVLCSSKKSKELKNIRPLDADVLQSVEVETNKMQEYWINIKIPRSIKAGIYHSYIYVKSNSTVVHKIPFSIEVYPFDLQPSPLIYSIYYRGKLSLDGKPTIGSEYKSIEQYRAEILNMKEHGVLYPTNYVKYNQKLKQTLEIRKKLNLPTDYFFNLGIAIGNTKDSKELVMLKKNIRLWIKLLRTYNYKNIYFYGIDEAEGNLLLSQKKVWQAVHDAGGKNFVATYNKKINSTIINMGSLLDAPVLAGKVKKQYADKWHSVGSKVFSYANPQVGEENPDKYRRNFGLLLLQAGYDGTMNYAYQHAFGHIWNDFDHKKYRDHVFTYPTINGVIDTIAWEGFREGTYDVRYAATLLDAISNSKNKALGEQALYWYKRINFDKENLDYIRKKMIEFILKLKSIDN